MSSLPLPMEQGDIDAVKARLDAHDHKEMAKFLIGREAKVNVTTASGWTPLHSVAFKGNREMAELLVEHGANVSAEIPRRRRVKTK